MSDNQKQELTETTSSPISEELYQALFDQAADGIFVTDTQGRCLEVNQRGCVMLGYTRQKLLTLSVQDLIPPEDLMRNPFHLDELRAGNIITNEYQLYCQGGRLVPVEISTQRLSNGRLLARVRDITKRKRAEQELQERERHSQSLLRLSRDMERAQTYTEILNAALAEVRSIIGYQSLWAYLLTEDKEYFRLLEAGGLLSDIVLSENGTATLTIKGDKMLEEIAEAREIVIVADAQTDERVNKEIVARLGNRTIVNVPIILFDRHLGSVGMGTFNKEGVRVPSSSEQKYLMALASHMAVSLDRIHLLTERKHAEKSLHRLNRELQAISNCNQILLRAVDEQTLLNDICRIVCEEAGYRMAWVGYAENDDIRTVRPIAWAGSENGYLAIANITWSDTERGHGPSGTAIRQGKSICIQDFATDPKVAPWRENALQRGYRSSIALPLKDENARTFGTLTIYSAEPNAFTPDEIRLLEELAGDLAFGIVVLRARIERKQTEGKLKESEEQLRLTLEATQIGIWDWDIKNDRWYASPTYYTMLGYEPQMGFTDRSGWLEGAHPEDRASVSEKIQNVLTKNFNEYHYEARMLHADGSYRWHYVKGFGIERDENGKVTRMLGTRIDINDRKQAEEALQRSEERFRSIVIAMNEGVVFQKKSGEITAVNPAAERILGTTEAELIGQTSNSRTQEARIIREDGSLFPGELHPAMITLRTGNPQSNVVMGIHRPDGTLVWISVNSQPLNSNGEPEPYAVVTTFRDITERKWAEESLRASEARFRTFVDHASDAFFLHVALGGAVLDINQQACESLGYSREELIGMTLPDFDVNADSGFLKQLRKRLRAGEVVAFDTRYHRKDGTTFPVEVRIRPFWQGGQRFSVSLARDISERKRAEIEREDLLNQIRQQAKEVQFIVDTVPEGMFLLSENGHVRLANSIAEQYLALLSPGWETNPLTRLGQYALIDLLTSPPKGLWHDVVINDWRFELIARPVENGPTNQGWVFVIRDVTREREIQQHLQAHERLAAVGQLAAGVAHDFNNTLAVIKLYTELLSRTLELSPRAQERLQIINQQTQRASDLIQQILDFSRQSVVERQPLNLLPFLKELVRLLKRTLPESIQIQLDYGQDEYVIHADPSRIQQAIMNLAVNARDAMSEGGKLTISLSSLEIESEAISPVPGMPSGEWIQISLADSGTGILPETLTHIFEPFFTTKERGKGTGLGLAQVYGIVQQHGGFIAVETEVGRGTAFQLYFPAFTLDWQVTVKPPTVALPQGRGQVVLVVEDEDAIRQALIESLTIFNYSTMEARNGREALSLLSQQDNKIALVLSDSVMPEMGGVALFHAMRERGLSIPFVIVTGHAVEKDMENLRILGLHGWLKKPPDLAELAKLLQQGLY